MAVSQGARSDTGGNRLVYLDGLRALAALFVLAHHGWAMVFPPQHGVAPDGWLNVTMWAKFGPYGVAVFIVLAGYSLTLAVAHQGGRMRRGPGEFLKRRARRLLPPYYIALVLTLLLSVLWLNQPTDTHWGLAVPLNWTGVWVNVLLLQDLLPFDVPGVSYTFWSIAVEWHIYFMFPALLLIWQRAGYSVAAAVGVVFGLAGSTAAVMVPMLEKVHFDFYALFAVGMWACAVVASKPAWAYRVPWQAVAMLSATGWVGLVALDFNPWLGIVLDADLAAGCAIAALLVSVGLGRSGAARAVLSAQPLVGVGLFSYSLYLIHAPLLQVVWLLLVEPFNLSQPASLTVMWLVACPLILGMAWVFSLIAERPFLNTRPKSLPELARR